MKVIQQIILWLQSLFASLIKLLLIIIFRLYRALISPYLPHACRYIPSCSRYALEALQNHKTWTACYLIGKRLFCCHPWSGFGYDPVPPKKQKSGVQIDE